MAMKIHMAFCITVIVATGGGNLRGADILEYTGAPGEIPRVARCGFISILG